MNREQRERYERGKADRQTFSVFAHFAVKIPTDTPFEFHEPRTTRTARTERNKPYKLSRLDLQLTLHFLFAPFSPGTVSELQGTLPLNTMNRERRERREQGLLLSSQLSVPP